MKEIDEAIFHLEDCVSNYPQHMKTALAALRLARYISDSNNDFDHLLDEIVKKYLMDKFTSCLKGE